MEMKLEQKLKIILLILIIILISLMSFGGLFIQKMVEWRIYYLNILREWI